jgi:hypothetical protein
MKHTIAAGFQRSIVLALLLCFSAAAAVAQSGRQAICQISWQNCLGIAEGKNWKPVYDRCLKARSACLGGRAFTPEIPAVSPSTPVQSILIQQGEGSGNDPANADPATRAAVCENGKPRGEDSSCLLAPAAEGYGQNFSLIGPGVPMSRILRASSVVKCAGGKTALFYPNGRIESCTLDNYGAVGTSLSDTSGKVVICTVHAVARFDPEGRLLSCDQF